MVTSKADIPWGVAVKMYAGMIMVSIMIGAVYPQLHDTVSLQKKYTQTHNVIAKKRIIQSLFSNNHQNERNSSTAQWKIDLLKMAVGDSSPLVVETALHQIKKLQLSELSSELCFLFTGADQKFGTYGDRVRIAVLDALGSLSCPGIVPILGDFLDRDKGSDIAGDVLTAIQRLDEYRLFDAVVRYKEKMHHQMQHLKAIGVNPIFYRRFLLYRDQARSVIRSLTMTIHNDNTSGMIAQ